MKKTAGTNFCHAQQICKHMQPQTKAFQCMFTLQQRTVTLVIQWVKREASVSVLLQI